MGRVGQAVGLLGQTAKVIELHDALIREFGGAPGILDKGILEAVLKRPFLGLANGTPFHPSVFDKAAALVEGMIRFHPFVDGNKRTAITLATVYLHENGIEFDYEVQGVVEFAVAIAEGKLTMREVVSWIREKAGKP